MRARTLIPLGLAAVLLSGCQPILDLFDPSGGDPNDNGDPTETGEAALRAFSSADEMRDYFIDQVRNTNDQYSLFESDEDDAVTSSPPSADSGFAQGDATAGEGPTDSADTVAPPAAPVDGDAGGSVEDSASDSEPFSGTTTQELDVQEADVVKTDGNYLYVLTGEALKIASVDPLEVIASLPMDGYGQDVYMLEDRLIILTEPPGEPKTITIDPLPVDGGIPEPGDVASGSSGSSDGATEPGDAIDAEPEPISQPAPPIEDDDPIASDDVIEPLDPDEDDGDVVTSHSPVEYLFYRPRVQVTVVDITDRAAPTILSRTAFEGRTVSSRMIDRRLHLVIVNHPEYFYDVLPLGQPEAAYDDIDLEDLLPDFVSTDANGQEVAGSIVGWQRFYRPADPDGFGVTSVISMDVDDAAGFEAVGVVAEPAMIYASREALYLTDMDYTWWGAQRESTDIYKFGFTETGVELTAVGSVPGRIADQYHMGEHNGDLRVASSTFPRFDQATGAFDEGGNHVYVLRNVEGSLEIVGRVENIAPGEDLKSVRFMGDRAIIVTFRQTDPFFTIDLSDPTAPRVAGEVEVPGFSTFMVPMDDDHMLTIGHYVPLEGWGVPNGIQLSIFDISDFAHPVRSHNVIVAGQSTSSEAVWNPKAFTYFPEHDLLALPMEIYNYDFWWQDWDFAIAEDGVAVAEADVDSLAPITEESDFVGLYVYRVTAEDGFEHLGQIATQDADMFYNTNRFTRGVFIGDNVYAVTDRKIIGAPVDAIESAPWSVELSDASDDVDGVSAPPIEEDAVLPD